MRTHLLVALLIIGMMVVPALPRARAASGTYFDSIVVVAMENQHYADVMGTGTGNACCPFIASLLSTGSTIPNYHGYGADGRSITGCSAACYVALNSGSTQGVSDSYCNTLSGCPSSPTWNTLTLLDRMVAAGLTWKAYCESGCPRYADHFPFVAVSTLFNSGNIFDSSTVSTTDFIAASNVTTPPNFLWFTPTDNHNMHNNSPATGDAYLKTFLVGSGTVSAPASGSLLANNIFKPGHRTLFMLWWDEYNPAPVLFYEPGVVKQAYVSSSDVYDEYSILHLMENNWSLSTLTDNDAAAAPMTEIFGASTTPASGGSGGGCFLCGSTSTWLFAIGGLLGLIGSLVLLTIRTRAKLARTGRRMNRPDR